MISPIQSAYSRHVNESKEEKEESEGCQGWGGARNGELLITRHKASLKQDE